MSYQLDHAICAVRSQEAAGAVCRGLGFASYPGGRHPAGSENSIVPLDVGFIELLSIYDEATARGYDRHRAICDYLDRRSGGLIGFALRSADIESDARRLRDSGVRYDGPTDARRVRPDGVELRWRVLRPDPLPSPTMLPILVWGDQSSESDLKHPNGVSAATAISIAVRSLDDAADLYRAVLGAQPADRLARPDVAATQLTFEVEGMEIRLLESTGPGAVRTALGETGPAPFALEFAADDLDRAAGIMGCTGPATGAPRRLNVDAGVLGFDLQVVERALPL